jgi:hypothetical protein
MNHFGKYPNPVKIRFVRLMRSSRMAADVAPSILRAKK